MKITKVPITVLQPDPKNARVHPEKNMAAIAASLEEFGQVEPLIVRQGSNIVVGGNGRLAAMRALGVKMVDVHYVELSDEKATALGLALNRTGELAEWDPKQLAETLKQFSGEGFLSEFAPLTEIMQFDPEETTALIEVGGYQRRASVPDDEKPPKEKKPPKEPEAVDHTKCEACGMRTMALLAAEAIVEALIEATKRNEIPKDSPIADALLDYLGAERENELAA